MEYFYIAVNRQHEQVKLWKKTFDLGLMAPESSRFHFYHGREHRQQASKPSSGAVLRADMFRKKPQGKGRGEKAT